MSDSHRRLERTLFIRTKQDKRCKFSRKSSYSSHVNHKSRKTNNSLSLCQIDMLEGLLFFVVVCLYVVHRLKKKTSSKICTFCPVLSNSKALSLIFCVLFWIFFFFFRTMPVYSVSGVPPPPLVSDNWTRG